MLKNHHSYATQSSLPTNVSAKSSRFLSHQFQLSFLSFSESSRMMCWHFVSQSKSSGFLLTVEFLHAIPLAICFIPSFLQLACMEKHLKAQLIECDDLCKVHSSTPYVIPSFSHPLNFSKYNLVLLALWFHTCCILPTIKIFPCSERSMLNSQNTLVQSSETLIFNFQKQLKFSK